jgi:hypothetical protein
LEVLKSPFSNGDFNRQIQSDNPEEAFEEAIGKIIEKKQASKENHPNCTGKPGG